MRYERKDIPKLIAVFEVAREVLIAKTTMHYLCHALDAALGYGHSAHAIQTAKALVNEAIGYRVSIAGYYRYDERYPTTSRGERRLRIRWCEKIIRDLKEYAK